MADQATIFNTDQVTAAPEGTSTTTPVDTSTAPQTQSEIVGLLVGEGKKYKSVEDLAKAYMSADDFIQTLKAENNELRSSATAGKTIEDVLQRLEQQAAPKQGDTPVDVGAIQKLVEQTVTGMETHKVKTANMLKADAMLKEVFGEKATEKYAEATPTPELKRVYMELAAVDPAKFVALFGVTPPPSQTVATPSSIRTEATQFVVGGTRATTEGTKEFYDKVRKENPAEYYSQEFQLAMDRAVRTNPSLFYGKK